MSSSDMKKSKLFLCILYPLKTHHVQRMLVLYLKTEIVSFTEQRFSSEVISVKHVDWSKEQIVNILA